LPMSRVLNQLGLDYLRDRWRGVNSLENHDLVMQPKDRNDHNRDGRHDRNWSRDGGSRDRNWNRDGGSRRDGNYRRHN